MVYREFKQYVAAFRQFLRENGATYQLPEELLAAKIVGRWQNGTPLAVSPDDDRLPQGPVDPRINDFGYAEDRDGFRCPLGAHIRRANPRDSVRIGRTVSDRHRMIRRGMPYGPELAEDALSEDREDRGLAFICFVGSIERQFEFVFGQWCNDGNAFGLGAEADFLVGTSGRQPTMTINGTPPIFLSRPENRRRGPAPFIRTRGGEYFYLPGIAGLHTLAQGTMYD
jgi:deferrochelatase/peroxidase EfeB